MRLTGGLDVQVGPTSTLSGGGTADERLRVLPNQASAFVVYRYRGRERLYVV